MNKRCEVPQGEILGSMLFKIIFDIHFASRPLQELCFLDQCSLVDGHTLSYFHVLPDAKLTLRFFKPWQDIVAACCKGNMESE